MALTAAQRITKAHIAIMRDPVFSLFAGLTTVGKTIVTKDIPTACTNGWDRLYNPDFVAKMTEDAELRYLVIHELVHMAYSHCTHYRELAKEDAQLTNIAMDFFVNLMMEDANGGRDFIKFPSVGGVKPDDKYRGWSVRQIYDDLKQQGQSGKGGGDGQQGFDDHDFSGQNSGNEDGDGGDQQAKASKAQAQANAIKQALHQGAQMQKKLQGKGNGPGGQDTTFGQLLEPQVNWRELLREFISECAAGKDVSTWRKPNRRFLADDVYMPSLQSETVDEVVVGIDTSGSTWCGNELPAFGTELESIMALVMPKKVHVIYWDTAIAGVQTFEDGQFAINECKPAGGGGTDASKLFDYLRTNKINPSCIINFTDGHVGSDWGKSDWPTLWCITSTVKAPFGTSIRLEV